MKNILYYISLVVLSLFVLNSCKKNENSGDTKIEDCGVNDAIVELAWLNDQKANCFIDIDCKTHFYTAVFDNKQVFYNQLEGSFCTPEFGITLYSCNGQVVKEYNENEEQQFINEVTEVKLLVICE